MKEQTLAIIKPDAIESNLSREIKIKILESGLDIVQMKTVRLSNETVNGFYKDHINKPFFPELLAYMTRSPVQVLVIEGENAVQMWRDMMGSTDPVTARPGTIRSMYGASVGENAVHGSDSKESAMAEISYMAVMGCIA